MTHSAKRIEQSAEGREHGAEGRGQKTDDRGQKTDNRGQRSEAVDCGFWTRRRPVGRDYAAANDAELTEEGENTNESQISSIINQ